MRNKDYTDEITQALYELKGIAESGFKDNSIEHSEIKQKVEKINGSILKHEKDIQNIKGSLKVTTWIIGIGCTILGSITTYIITKLLGG